MLKEEKVNIINLTTFEEESCVLKVEREDPCFLELRTADFEVKSCESDFLEASISLRKLLHAKGYDILVNASRENIAASGMLRSSGSASAYLLKLGVEISMEDMIYLFDPISKDELESLEAQEQFFDIFQASLKQGRK